MRVLGMSVLAASLALTGCDPGCEDASGVACSYLGDGTFGLDPDGTEAEEVRIYWAYDIEFAPDGTPYFIDWNNHIIRRVVDGKVETVMGFIETIDEQTNSFAGDGDPAGADLTADGALGTTVRLNHPTDMQFDGEGRMIVAAWHNHKIRRFDPSSGMVNTILGRGAGFAGDGGPMAMALVNQPSGLIRTSDGTLFILDQRNHRIRRVAPDGTIATVVGTGMPGFSGDDGPALMAQLRFEAGPNPEPSGGIAFDEAANILYIADGLNHVVRRVDLTNDVITTVVGTPETAGFAGDGGSGLGAQLNHPRQLEIGPDGRLYIADTENHRVRAWDPASDVIETVVGTGDPAMNDDGVDATEINLDRPLGIAFGPDDALYVADTLHARYLRIPQ
jgi:DNA-binding beta-propeller fold protein YncE